MVDIRIEDRGADAHVRPLTQLGRAWLDRHLRRGSESESAVVVKHGAIPDIVAAAQGDGVVVRVAYSRTCDPHR